MSYCQLKYVSTEGPVLTDIEYRNSWGYAARIWTDLFDRYAKDPKDEHDSWLSRTVPSSDDDGSKRLWRLADDVRLETFERQILRSTFDNAIVLSKDFQEMADALRVFADKYPAGNKVCHLDKMAERLEQLKNNPGVLAVCWHHTSVNEDPWMGRFGEPGYCNECGHSLVQESEAYDIHKGDKHWYVDFSKPEGICHTCKGTRKVRREYPVAESIDPTGKRTYSRPCPDCAEADQILVNEGRT